MELHQLRYVMAVAQTGNFSRAAARCHVSQPSLSQQILKLEAELGERLFHRQRQHSRLTAAGERFVLRAARILDEVNAALEEADDSQGVVRGEVRLGVIPTIAPYFLPEILADFRVRHVGVRVTVLEEPTLSLRRLAAGYELDLAVASAPLDDARMQVVPLFDDELLLAVPARHPMARRREIRPQDLVREEILIMKEQHCLGDQVLNFCTAGGRRPEIVFRSAQLDTIQAMVKAGLGVSLVPAMARRRGPAAPVYRSIAGRRVARQIVAFWPQGRALERPAAVLLDALRAGRKA